MEAIGEGARWRNGALEMDLQLLDFLDSEQNENAVWGFIHNLWKTCSAKKSDWTEGGAGLIVRPGWIELVVRSGC